jgi:transcriptional regulator with XRE-family HTH domain
MNDNVFLQFGQFLQSLRKAKGLSQEQLAEIAELDRIYISLLERGKRNPSLSCILAICQALDIDFMNKLQTQDWVTELVQFCQRYDLEVEYLPEILNDPKVIPMIRGKSFEFTVKKYLAQILSDNYIIMNPRLNAQTGSYDVDVLVINRQTQKQYSIECKLASKGSFRLSKEGNPYLKVKCMRSRTLGDEAAKQREKTTGISYNLWRVHRDQYRQEEFDFVVTSIGNAFYETDEKGLYFWKPTLNAQKFLDKLGINNQADAFSKMFIARSRDLIANENNYTNFKIECTRQKCKDANCGFIPNKPYIYFDKDTGIPLYPWIPLEEINTLLD